MDLIATSYSGSSAISAIFQMKTTRVGVLNNGSTSVLNYADFINESVNKRVSVTGLSSESPLKK
jgi:hypothetical protein